MCLVVLAWQALERYPLVVAANRDEHHERPTLAAAWWPELPHVFGGRDLVAHGSWLAVDNAGRLAAVTNLREVGAPPAARSRGGLVQDFLAGTDSIDALLGRLDTHGSDYGPFNLLLLDRDALAYASNRAATASLATGVHAFSNAPLGTEWPKLQTARQGMREALAANDPADALFALLARRAPAAESEDRYRRALFIDGPVYGTRSSTVILLSAAGELTFAERSFDARARPTGEIRERILLTRT